MAKIGNTKSVISRRQTNRKALKVKSSSQNVITSFRVLAGQMNSSNSQKLHSKNFISVKAFHQMCEDCGDAGILVNFFRELSDQASRVLEGRHLDRAANNKKDVN